MGGNEAEGGIEDGDQFHPLFCWGSGVVTVQITPNTGAISGIFRAEFRPRARVRFSARMRFDHLLRALPGEVARTGGETACGRIPPGKRCADPKLEYDHASVNLLLVHLPKEFCNLRVSVGAILARSWRTVLVNHHLRT